MYQIEKLLDWYFGNRAQFPRDVWVIQVPVEIAKLGDGHTELRLRPPLPNQEPPRHPLPDGIDRVEYKEIGLVAERINFKEYDVADTVTVLAAYSDTAKRLFIGKME